MKKCYPCLWFKYPNPDDGGYEEFNKKNSKFHIKKFKRQKISEHALKNSVEKTPIDNLVKVKHFDLSGKNSAIAKACYTFGCYISRELHYGIMFNQKYLCKCSGDTWHMYLFMDGDYAIGAVGFVYQQWKNMDTLWELRWIWIHPDYRRKGILANAFGYFKKNYSPFTVAEPLSDAMKSFLKNNSHGTVQTTGDKVFGVKVY